MSKATKTKNSLRRRTEKRNRKAANTARYASYIGTSANSKRKNGKNVKNNIPGHPHTKELICGNVGCAKCFPHLQTF